MTVRLVLWGAGGHALSLREALRRSGRSVDAFIVDDGMPSHPELAPLVRGEAELLRWLGPAPSEILVAIGLNGAVRQRIAAVAERIGLVATPFQDVAAIGAADTRLGAGSQVLAAAYLGPGASVGAHGIVNVGAIVEHEATVGAFSDLAPRATVLGKARIGSRVLVGAGATVLPGIAICDDVVIGAGAVVTRDIERPGTYVGVPARPATRS